MLWGALRKGRQGARQASRPLRDCGGEIAAGLVELSVRSPFLTGDLGGCES